MNKITASTYHKLFQHSIFLRAKNIAVFCNHIAFDYLRKSYLVDELIDSGKLSNIFTPEHGLFAAVQDQVKIPSSSYRNIPCTSLYEKDTSALETIRESLKNIDALVVDIQDVGVRYFTYVSHLIHLLNATSHVNCELPILIVNRKNPIGRKVEGSIIQKEYASILGMPNLIHRHGLSIGELCRWHLIKSSIELKTTNISIDDSNYFIPPSPNLPTMNSLLVYPGQCLWEATHFSKGRGTTTPFELFGHPDLSMDYVSHLASAFNKKFNGLAFLRPTKFIPCHHKHKNKVCNGWQLTILDQIQYHTIFGSLFLMQQIRKQCPEMNFWLTGPYEFDSENSAAQSLIGDDLLIDFVNGTHDEDVVREHFYESEKIWRMELAPIELN